MGARERLDDTPPDELAGADARNEEFEPFDEGVGLDSSDRLGEPDDGTESSVAQPRAHRVVPDPLYGAISVSRWAQSLLDLAPFRRMEGVSLSDVPGDILFNHEFPSRLTHSLGVYHLARQARPRDRAAQSAALAHDIGHGPFSHLTEPLMIERLGMDHEQRSAALIREAVTGATGLTARLLSWLDLDEVCALITGTSSDGRGALLNGALDYDNLDNVARFAQAAGICEPGYDGLEVARGLRPFTDGTDAGVALAPEARPAALAWQADRALVYGFLQTDGWNVAAHAMLRKAIDIAARDGGLDDSFFELTDAGALQALRGAPTSRPLVDGVISGEPYRVIWEALVPDTQERIPAAFAAWRNRLALEERIATEAGLRPIGLISVYLVSRVARRLPPIAGETHQVMEAQPERIVRVLVAPGVGQDYIRRARMAAERTLGALGAVSRGWPELR